MRLRARGARSGRRAQAKGAPRGRKSQPRRSVGWVGLVSSIAKWFGPACGGVSAAKLAQFAAKFAKARRGKFRSGRRRKSTARSLLSGRVSLGSGRDVDGRWPEGQVVSACRRVVAQVRGCPTARVSQESQRAFRLLAARSRQPRCEVVWPRLRAGFCCKSVRACREIHHGPARQILSSVAKKRMVGPRFGECGLSSTGGQIAAWPLRAGVVFYFHRLQPKFTTSWRFCQVVSFTTKFSNHFFVQRQVCAHAAG